MFQALDGTRVLLRVAGYEFPHHKGRSTPAEVDFDANWLLVQGEIQTPDDEGWQFCDPCMLTWEAKGFGLWLAQAAGVAPPEVLVGDAEPVLSWEPNQIGFLEPNLEWSLRERDDVLVTVDLVLSLEALPPWVDGRGPFTIPLTLHRDDLAEAAVRWLEEVSHYPYR